MTADNSIMNGEWRMENEGRKMENRELRILDPGFLVRRSFSEGGWILDSFSLLSG
jgi:hypothetical protein